MHSITQEHEYSLSSALIILNYLFYSMCCTVYHMEIFVIKKYIQFIWLEGIELCIRYLLKYAFLNIFKMICCKSRPGVLRNIITDLNYIHFFAGCLRGIFLRPKN